MTVFKKQNDTFQHNLEPMDVIEEYSEDTSFDSTEENYELVYEKESEFLDKEKQQDQYYIGIYKNIENELVYVNALSNYTFFHFPYYFVLNYLYFYSIIHLDIFSTEMNIMKLNIAKDGTYCIVVKTFWIKIIQRAWKRIFAKRREILRQRGSIDAQFYFSQHGKYPPSLQYLPNIYGLFVKRH